MIDPEMKFIKGHYKQKGNTWDEGLALWHCKEIKTMHKEVDHCFERKSRPWGRKSVSIQRWTSQNTGGVCWWEEGHCLVETRYWAWEIFARRAWASLKSGKRSNSRSKENLEKPWRRKGDRCESWRGQ